MEDVTFDKIVIRISDHPSFDYQIDCILRTHSGRFCKNFDATEEFIKEAGLLYFTKQTLKSYQDATKKSR
jgi:hypothetical protein